jgi:hypothetical protein
VWANIQLIFLKAEEMVMLDTLIALSGHDGPNGPQNSDSVLTVLDTELATWPLTRLQDAHRKQDIHIVPANPSEPMAFDSSTCEALGINMHQTRQIHGKSFQCRYFRHALIPI